MTDRAAATLRASVAELAGVRAPLRRTTVREVMTTAVISVTPTSSFDEVARLLQANSVRALPVLDPAGHRLGVVSGADLRGTAQQRRSEARGNRAKFARKSDKNI
jgi:CBS domain-containing protein